MPKKTAIHPNAIEAKHPRQLQAVSMSIQPHGEQLVASKPPSRLPRRVAAPTTNSADRFIGRRRAAVDTLT
jgi:hypothetical protein